MFFIQENDILRKYSYIDLQDSKKMDHQFRTKVIEFLQNSLLNILRFIDNELAQVDDAETKTTKFYFKGEKQTGYLEARAFGYTDNSEKVIEIILKEGRAGEEKIEHQLKIKFESRVEESKTFSIGFDTNTYWEGQGLDFNYLCDSISKHLKKFDQDKNGIKNKNFIGWINISVHPMHECYILGNKQKVEEFVKEIKCKRKYKVVFCLNPQMGFDLTKAIIFET